MGKPPYSTLSIPVSQPSITTVDGGVDVGAGGGSSPPAPIVRAAGTYIRPPINNITPSNATFLNMLSSFLSIGYLKRFLDEMKDSFLL
jgi:hypothetical protein